MPKKTERPKQWLCEIPGCLTGPAVIDAATEEEAADTYRAVSGVTTHRMPMTVSLIEPDAMQTAEAPADDKQRVSGEPTDSKG